MGKLAVKMDAFRLAHLTTDLGVLTHQLSDCFHSARNLGANLSIVHHDTLGLEFEAPTFNWVAVLSAIDDRTEPE